MSATIRSGQQERPEREGRLVDKDSEYALPFPRDKVDIDIRIKSSAKNEDGTKRKENHHTPR